MAITIDYTPYGAVADLASQAGAARASEVAAERQMRVDLAGMQMAMQNANMQFQARMQQEAQQEQFQQQVQILQMKKQIDMDVELQQYAMDKQKLNSTLSLIRDSGYSDEEKEKLTIQAQAKYAGVGQGITDDKMGAGNMGDFMQKTSMKARLVQEMQSAVEGKAMTAEQANAYLAAAGMPAVIKDPEKVMQQKFEDAGDRLKKAQNELRTNFATKGKTVYKTDKTGKRTEEKVKPGTPEYAYYELLQQNQDSAKQDLYDLLNNQQQDQPDLEGQFEQEASASPSMQMAIKLYGKETVFKGWAEGLKSRQSQVKEEEKKGYPWWGYHPAGAAFMAGKKLTGG